MISSFYVFSSGHLGVLVDWNGEVYLTGLEKVLGCTHTSRKAITPVGYVDSLDEPCSIRW